MQYVKSNIRAIVSKMVGTEVTCQIIPASSACGTTTIGMNWTICSSVRAKVDRKMPRLTATRPSRNVITNANSGEPALYTPRPMLNDEKGPIAGTLMLISTNVRTTTDCSVAKNVKPAL